MSAPHIIITPATSSPATPAAQTLPNATIGWTSAGACGDGLLRSAKPSPSARSTGHSCPLSMTRHSHGSRHSGPLEPDVWMLPRRYLVNGAQSIHEARPTHHFHPMSARCYGWPMDLRRAVSPLRRGHCGLRRAGVAAVGNNTDPASAVWVSDPAVTGTQVDAGPCLPVATAIPGPPKKPSDGHWVRWGQPRHRAPRSTVRQPLSRPPIRPTVGLPGLDTVQSEPSALLHPDLPWFRGRGPTPSEEDTGTSVSLTGTARWSRPPRSGVDPVDQRIRGPAPTSDDAPYFYMGRQTGSGTSRAINMQNWARAPVSGNECRQGLEPEPAG